MARREIAIPMHESSTQQAVFEKLALVGAGLIGSSIARAAREFGAANKIAIYDANPAVMARVQALGLADVDAPLEDLASTVLDADLIIICTPVGACSAVAKVIAPHLKA